MKLKIFSDLHLEFGSLHLIDELFKDDVDYYVIAGDLSDSRSIIESLSEIDKITNHPVIYVPGNHEYYHSQKGYIDSLFEKNEESWKNIIILNDNWYIDDNVVFIGSTGWWEDGITGYHLKAMNDFSLIYDIKENLNGCKWGIQSRRYFEKSLKEFSYKDEKVICISHNMPSTACISKEFIGDALNVCFAMNYDDLLEYYQPNLWICGHTHDSFDMKVFNTRIVCNPYGYFNYQQNKDFDYNLIIEV